MFCSKLHFSKRDLLYFPIVLLLLFITFGTTYAHVGLNYPEEGNKFSPGDTVTIKWEVLIEHNQNNWDILFSADSGQSWQPIEEDIEVSKTSYEWIVPDTMSTKVFIRVIQDNERRNYDDKNGPFTITAQTTDIKNSSEIPDQLTLGKNYPNPFNPVTTIPFRLNSSNKVVLQVIDINGRVIRTLIKGSMEAGSYTIPFRASNLSSGTYFYQLKVGKQSFTRKMILLK